MVFLILSGSMSSDPLDTQFRFRVSAYALSRPSSKSHFHACNLKISVAGESISYSLEPKPPKNACPISELEQFSTLSGYYEGMTLSFLVMASKKLAIPITVLDKGLYNAINGILLESWSVIRPFKLETKSSDFVYITKCGSRCDHFGSCLSVSFLELGYLPLLTAPL